MSPFVLNQEVIIPRKLSVRVSNSKADLAQTTAAVPSACYSEFHFIRLFMSLTSITNNIGTITNPVARQLYRALATLTHEPCRLHRHLTFVFSLAGTVVIQSNQVKVETHSIVVFPKV